MARCRDRTLLQPGESARMTNGGVAIGIIGAGIMGERLLGAILQQGPALVQACGIWDPSPDAMRRAKRKGDMSGRPQGP